MTIVLATMSRGGVEIATPSIDALKAEIIARKIDVLIIDPFVKSHRVPENDNGAIDVVVTAFARIADAAECAIELVHHVRKTGGAEITVEDGRGAVALLAGVRSARVPNPMTKEEAEQAGGLVAREHFRVTNGRPTSHPLRTARNGSSCSPSRSKTATRKTRLTPATRWVSSRVGSGRTSWPR